MIDRPQTQFTLHRFESGFDLCQLDIAFPEHSRIFTGEIRAQQIMSVPLLRLLQLFFIGGNGERFRRHLLVRLGHSYGDESKRSSGFFFRCANTQQQLITFRQTLAHSTQLA
jgi:hypothetical protein